MTFASTISGQQKILLQDTRQGTKKVWFCLKIVILYSSFSKIQNWRLAASIGKLGSHLVVETWQTTSNLRQDNLNQNKDDSIWRWIMRQINKFSNNKKNFKTYLNQIIFQYFTAGPYTQTSATGLILIDLKELYCQIQRLL